MRIHGDILPLFPTFQLRELRHREVNEESAQGQAAGKWWVFTPRPSDSRAYAFNHHAVLPQTFLTQAIVQECEGIPPPGPLEDNSKASTCKQNAHNVTKRNFGAWWWGIMHQVDARTRWLLKLLQKLGRPEMVCNRLKKSQSFLGLGWPTTGLSSLLLLGILFQLPQKLHSIHCAQLVPSSYFHI